MRSHGDMIYSVGRSGQNVVIKQNVVNYLLKKRRLKWWHVGKDGQLFARIVKNEIIICDYTGPHYRSWKNWFAHAMDPVIAQREIDDRHRSGLHYIGEWFTNSNVGNMISQKDEAVMMSRVNESCHDLNGFVFIMVGRQEFPDCITVIVNDGNKSFLLRSETN